MGPFHLKASPTFLRRGALGRRVPFETLPVVHLEAGRFPEYPGVDPERVLTQLARRFGRVALVDVEGIRSNEPQVEFLQAASRRRALWVDAGSRYATDAMDVFVAGADALTMRWNTLRDARELDEAAQLAQPGSLFLALEFPKGHFLPNPRDKRGPEQVVQLAESAGVDVVMIGDALDSSALRGLPPARTHRWVQGLPRRLLGDAESMGFAGALLAPSELPPEEASP